MIQRVVCRAMLLLILGNSIVLSQTWVLKVPASANNVLGNPLTSNPRNQDIIYGSAGNNYVYVSRNKGVAWSVHGNPTPIFGTDPNVIKFIGVSPLDTNQLLVALECSGSVPDRILKSTNNGLTWLPTWEGTFSYYGKPVEFEPAHPDTVYTMGNDTVFRSTNFGSTWDTMMVARELGHFNAWCDAESRIDSANILFLGDAASGIWKTYDYGAHWKKVYASIGFGEIPSIAIDPFDQRVCYATRFSGGGGLMKSTDWGESWHDITTPAGLSSTWWVTCSPVNRGYVYFGMYNTTPGGVYISRDSGGSWENFIDGLTVQGKFNYGLHVQDSLTVIALQANGINRLEYPKSIHVVSPNGGESYASTLHHTIAWTQANLYFVKLQFSTNNGGTWVTLQDSIPPSQSSYDWTVPVLTSTQCRMRVVDALFTSTADTSDAAFSITPFTLVSPMGGEHWIAGSTHPLSWVASDFPFVDLYYSSDSGSSWQYIATRPSTSGSLLWLVPQVASNGMKIKIVNAADTAIHVMSGGFFTVLLTSQFATLLAVHDGGLGSDSLKFGGVPGATDLIDTLLGEIELSPRPSPGTFDVRWSIPATNGSRIDFRDTIGASNVLNTFIAELQPGAGGYPLNLSWDPDSLTAGVYILRDLSTHGGRLSVDMRRASSAVIPDSSYSPVEIIESQTTTLTVDASAGWKLLSLPIDVGDRRKSVLFPYSTSAAFIFTGGYVQADTIPFGKGFWIKTGKTTINGSGRANDTVALRSGWNMVGSVSTPVSTLSVTTIPNNLIVSSFYEYSGTYHTALTLVPGKGYWVKSAAPGKLILSGASVNAAEQTAGISKENRFHSLSIKNERGEEAELFFGTEGEGVKIGQFELPPTPPENGADARFSGDLCLQLHPKTFENMLEYPIYVFFEGEKIYFTWGVENEENFTYILSEKRSDKEVAETRLTGHGTLLIRHGNQSTFTLKIFHSTGSTEQPRSFSLGEVYPNPFNPSAKLSFTVPSAANVNISIYSTLGERVATIVEDLFEAGEYSTAWHGVRSDGVAVSSGMYFIRMRASLRASGGNARHEDFVSVRKVLLLK